MSDIVLFSIGNPGPLTRHSCGHYALEQLIDYFGAPQLVKSSTFSYTAIRLLNLVKSNAYMNESDKAIRKYCEKHKVKTETPIFVLYDDFETPLGRIKISEFKKNESHNGIKSLRNHAQYKLGIGIGPKPQSASRDTMASWVLSPFTQNEREILKSKSIPMLIDYVEFIEEVEGEIDDCTKVNSYFSKNSVY